ncbi:prenylated Rab acceptor protein 1-like [Rhipicephalus microplus]|uniref:prenylated Rab acceptor protein 1-like n=1 Tax=Rhipicephalus microplus TaxID=6941 RepID=UPI003F6CA4C9
MDREQGDVGDPFDSATPKLPEPKLPEPTPSDDATAVAPRFPTPMPQRRRFFPAAAREESDLVRSTTSWCWEQIERAQPWDVFLNPWKVSFPRSFGEFASRLPSNLDAFRGNYFVVLLIILAFTVTDEWMAVLAVAAVALVCAALKLHEEGDNATFWGTETAMFGGKIQRLVVAAAVALPLFYYADMWTAVTWSFEATTAVVIVHATLHAGPGIAAELAKKLEVIPEEGDMPPL